MNNNQASFLELSVKTIVVHTVTYMLMGILASTLMDYKEVFSLPWMVCWMRQFGDPMITAGPLFQPIRGIVFALAFYPLRKILFGKRYGWLVMWWLLVALGILSTFGPAPGSIEGMIYTIIPMGSQLRGWLEVVPQALLFSVCLCYWVNHPEKKWLNWVLGIVFAIAVILPVLGLFIGSGKSSESQQTYSLRIVDSGIIRPFGPGETLRVRTFPSLVVLSDGTLLAACRAGSTKDSDDGIIEIFRSSDNGATWSEPAIPFGPTNVEGVRGSYHLCYMTELQAGHLLAACLWIDRETFPGKPLFNPDTEGCLPMAILLADSYDSGKTWTPLRKVSLPDDIGPPSLTNPLIKLANGSLAISIETNKTYTDSSKWHQKVLFFLSPDAGKTWGNPVTTGCDPTGRIFNWDQRVGVAHDGTIAAFLWTYNSETKKYLNIHRRLSTDNGESWSEAEDMGFTDQAGHPAVLNDRRVVLCWVDRFHSHSIRARLASSIDGPFDPETEIEVYRHEILDRKGTKSDTTGDLLEGMNFWTYGLPYAEVLSDGDVIVVYYAGDTKTMNVHWARIAIIPSKKAIQ